MYLELELQFGILDEPKMVLRKLDTHLQTPLTCAVLLLYNTELETF